MALPLLLGACQGPAMWERVLLMHPGAWAQQVNNQRGEAWREAGLPWVSEMEVKRVAAQVWHFLHLFWKRRR